MTFNFVAAPLAMLALGAVVGCTPAAGATASAAGEGRPSSAESPVIASVHQRQCGRCHSAPEAGKHPRPYLEEALSHHRKRVHLTEEEWTQMVDFLAAERSGG